MEIQSTIKNQQHQIFKFQNSTSKRFFQENSEHYFFKHWQVIEKSIKILILQRKPINLPAFIKSLQFLIIHNHTTNLHQSLTKLWYQIFSYVLKNHIQQQNPLISLIQYYKQISCQIKIILTILDGKLSKTVKKPDSQGEDGKLIINEKQTIESKAYNILCNEIINHPSVDNFLRDMLLVIDTFRNDSYDKQNSLTIQSAKAQIILDMTLMKKIGIFKKMQSDFLQHSKNFYVYLGSSIKKNENMFQFIQGFLIRQAQLNKIFEPSENTCLYAQKELVQEFYESMISFLQILIEKNNKNCLKILWRFTLRLGDNAFKIFTKYLKELIMSSKKFINLKETQKIFGIVEYRQKLVQIIDNCFDKNRKIVNLIHNSFEQLLFEEEKAFIGITLQNSLKQENPLQENFQENKIFKLFKLAPHKQNFIRQFQVRLCRWILSKGFQLVNLSFQERFVNQIKKEVGNNLVKKLDRMVFDVWRDNTMNFLYAQQGRLKCLFLSNNWPKFGSYSFNIPDQLQQILDEYQTTYKSIIENAQKQINWAHEFGTIKLAINGIDSLFNVLQASIIIILDHSIRPLKKQQLLSSLNITTSSQNAEDILHSTLGNLVESNILNYSDQSQTFDINDENTVSYQHESKNQERQVESIKRNNVARDDGIIVEAAIVRILKKRKNMQKTDIARFIQETIKNFKPTFQQITKAFDKLQARKFIQINKTKGIISYLQ